jgi:hypothetical protein
MSIAMKPFISKNINALCIGWTKQSDNFYDEIALKYLSNGKYAISEVTSSPSPVDGQFVVAGQESLKLVISSITNFRAGDVIEVNSINDLPLIELVFGVGTTEWLGPIQLKVLSVTVNTNDTHDIIVDFPTIINTTTGLDGTAKIIYHKLIKYIGEVNGVSNVQEANKAYTEVYAHIPDHTGQTPDILFRTIADTNYKPGLIFPIIPSQYQPEIIGAELFSSPIVSNPTEYPGSYYGQFDTIDFTYECESGDTLRRSGRYYGVSGDIDNQITDPSNLDGISVDFTGFKVQPFYFEMPENRRFTPFFI